MQYSVSSGDWLMARLVLQNGNERIAAGNSKSSFVFMEFLICVVLVVNGSYDITLMQEFK
jgi:hypothetical protein